MSGYVAGWHMPGYLPETDPAPFDDVADAVAYLCAELTLVADSETVTDPDIGEMESVTSAQARRVLRDLDPDHSHTWWDGVPPFTSTPVGGYVYWIEPA